MRSLTRLMRNPLTACRGVALPIPSAFSTESSRSSTDGEKSMNGVGCWGKLEGKRMSAGGGGGG